MTIDIDDLTTHNHGEDCPVCRAQGLVDMVLLPAAYAWEQQNQLPELSLALHGAAGLLGAMLDEGVPRDEVDSVLGRLLDDIEQQIAENRTMGGPPVGNA